MTGKERVKAAINYKKVDKVPVQFYYCPVGYYEHGEKLNDLYSMLEGDFEPFVRKEIPKLPPEVFEEDGSYHEFRTDAWGTLWEYRIYGITGIPKKYPINSSSDMDNYKLPPALDLKGDSFKALKERVEQLNSQGFYSMVNCGSLYEKLIALYNEEDVMCDINTDEPEINRLADRIMEYNATFVQGAILAGADGICFGDDYGTQNSLVFSPKVWRSFFKPRLRELFAPAVKAGLNIHFHSCGKINEIFEDLREVGVNSIWPQLPLYDMKELAEYCRSIGLAVAVHTDRAYTMTFGTPQMVRELVLREYEIFRMHEGGSWFYIEADNGFPFENIKALVETIREIR